MPTGSRVFAQISSSHRRVRTTRFSRAPTLSRRRPYTSSLRPRSGTWSEGSPEAGLITAHPLAARRLVHAIEQTRRAVAAELDRRRPVSVFLDLGGYQGATDQSLAGDLIREARGRNVSGRGGISPIAGISEIVRANPEVYVAVASSGTTLDTLRKTKAKRLTAVRNGRVVVVDDRLLEPSPAIGRGLVELARALHPEAVP